MKNLITAVVFVVAVGLLACGTPTPTGTGGGSGGGGGGGGTTEKSSLELYSWWSNPSEAGALDKIFAIYKRENPNTSIINGAGNKTSVEAQAEMLQRRIDNNPPDLFQMNPRSLGVWTAFNPDGGVGPNTLESLEDIMAPAKALIPADVLDVVSYKGVVYAIPLNLHRQNGMFYNKSVFTTLSLTPPSSMATFFATCDAIQASNATKPDAQKVTPIASSRQGWMLAITFRAVVAASAEEVTPGHGNEYLAKLMSGKGHPATDPEFAKAVTNMNKVLACSNQPTTDSYGWTDAAAEIKSGKAAMFVHGDWAKGELVAQGAIAGADFDVTGAFGTGKMFLYNLDAFALFQGAKHPAEARAMLKTMLSVDGQTQFNMVKGSSPIRSDVPLTSFDPVAKKTYSELQGATSIVSTERDFTSFWDVTAASLISFWDKRKAHNYDTTDLAADVAAVGTAAEGAYGELRAQNVH